MQIIDVLRDHRRYLAGAVEAGERKVAAPGPGGGKLCIHGKTPPPRLITHVLAREELVERDRPVLGPEPAGRAKVRDAALRGNSGSGERADHACAVHVLLQFVDSGLQVRRDHVLSVLCPGDAKRSLPMRYLHTMLRVRNLDQALDFYCNKLGLKEERRRVDDKNRYTLVFLAAPEDEGLVEESKRTGRDAPLVELTYNWDSEDYGDARYFGHLAYEVDDIYALCERLMKAGVTINRPQRDTKWSHKRVHARLPTRDGAADPGPLRTGAVPALQRTTSP